MDERARFEQLWRDHAPAVVAYTRRRAEADIAEDAVAETFLVAWRRLDRVPDNALPWLLGVARRALANQRRAQVRRAALLDRLDLSMPAVTTDNSDRGVLEALATLSERDRELLMLVGWEGLSPAEAAAALGSSPIACRVRLHRARTRLAAALYAVEMTLGRSKATTKEPPSVKEARS